MNVPPCMSLDVLPAFADTLYALPGMSEPRGRLAQCSVSLRAVLAASRAGGAGVEWGVQAALAASRCALAAAAAALAFAAACCCLCRCLGLLSAKLLRLLQLRCSSSVTSFFHSQNVVLKNTGCNCAALRPRPRCVSPGPVTCCVVVFDSHRRLSVIPSAKAGGGE